MSCIGRLNKENIPSRAYIAFKDEKLLAEFSKEYDGHLFRDKAGTSPSSNILCERGRLGLVRERIHRGRRVCAISEGP